MPAETIQRILVVGGGPTGLVTLRNLVERGAFNHVELYERRDDVGGVWYFDEPGKADDHNPRWPSPAYKGLIGNVLPEFLSFSEFPFNDPPSAPHQPYPTLGETHEYLRAFAEPYLKSGKIKLKRQVVRVTELNDGGWNVLSRDWNADGNEVEETWDAVAVAVGWYDHPVWPQTEGLDELRKRDLAAHAKWWRGPLGYEGKKVLVVGNANSSNEVAAQLAPVAKGPVFQSIRRAAFPGFPSLPDERIKTVAPVSKYIVKTDGSNKFAALLDDGTSLTDFDTVQIGTGYRPFPDFIHVLDAERRNSQPLVSEDTLPNRVPSLHRLIMYAFNPSLAFIGALMAYTPFTIADVASTWLALAWVGEVAYPDTPEARLAFERQRLALVEKARSETENPTSFLVYNVLGPFEQEYGSTLKEDVVRARPQLASILPDWSDEKTELRETMFKTKLKALEYARDHAVVRKP